MEVGVSIGFEIRAGRSHRCRAADSRSPGALARGGEREFRSVRGTVEVSTTKWLFVRSAGSRMVTVGHMPHMPQAGNHQMQRASKSPLLILRIILFLVGLGSVLVAVAWGGFSADLSNWSPTRSTLVLGGVVLILLALIIRANRQLILLFFLSSLVSYSVAVVLLTSNAARHLGFTRHAGFSFGSIGIFQEDPLLGFDHIPRSTGREKSFGFDVTYTIDESHCRVTRTPSSSRGTVLFLGGSFTFGYGVEDDENYPAILASEFWTDHKIRNRSVNAWGTVQAYVALKRELETEKLPIAVCYGWIENHSKRNYLRRSWLEVLGQRRNPHFEIERNRLVFKGLAGPEQGVEPSILLYEKEEEITQRLVAEMARICRTRGVPFFLLRLPEARVGGGVHLFTCSTDGAPISVLNATQVIGPILDTSGHPTPKLHLELARFIADSEMGKALKGE